VKLRYVLIAVAAAVSVAIVFTLPLLTTQVQRIETYKETGMSLELYTAVEPVEMEVPHSEMITRQKVSFDMQHRKTCIGFLIRRFAAADEAKITRTPDGWIQVPSSGSIFASWSVAESDRRSPSIAGVCLPEAGIASSPEDRPVVSNHEVGWEGKIEVPCEKFFFLYPRNIIFIYLCIGYYCDAPGPMPPIDISTHYTWYSTETVNKEVTKSRLVPVEIEKQRVVTDYRKISVWHWLFEER